MSEANRVSGSVIVSWNYDPDEKENAVMLVGKKDANSDTEVINGFVGAEVLEIIDKLTTLKGEK